VEIRRGLIRESLFAQAINHVVPYHHGGWPDA
jgi:hypothetical protein